ncbi:MAG: choice-of-anchor I family protein [Cyanobacteria bacterium J06627_15]
MALKPIWGAIAPAAVLIGAIATPANAVSLDLQGRYDGNPDELVEGAAEISAYDPVSQQLFVTNSDENTIDFIGITDPMNPVLNFQLDLTPFGAGINSVAFSNGILAAALEADIATDDGSVAFFDSTGTDITQVTVGALPDMLTFTPDGTKLLVANEGEPNDEYTIDPRGSVSIIDVASFDVNTLFFDDVDIPEDVRVFGPGATPAQDLEPEYIAVAPDGTQAFVALQENNAIAVLDLVDEEFTEVFGLGFKDFNDPANPIDASNRDDGINIQNWPVFGMYQPDAIAAYEAADGNTYIVTANEGDARDYDGFTEEFRVGDDEIVLDPTAFPNAKELKEDENLGRLRITNTLGDTDGDGDFDELYAYGGRSFSIFDADGNLVFDSAAELEKITAEQVPELFNGQDNDPGEFDDRSDDKGPEPEGVTVGKFKGRTLAFIGLERVGGVMIYDITDPKEAKFLNYTPNPPEDISPEGILYISAEDSPTGVPLLVTTNEVSGTTAIYAVVPEPGTIIGLISAVAATGLGLKRKQR